MIEDRTQTMLLGLKDSFFQRLQKYFIVHFHSVRKVELCWLEQRRIYMIYYKYI